MDAPDDKPEQDTSSRVGEVGDSLRTAVERTLAVTADSATGTRQRAQELVDDVVRRGQAARDGVTRRGTDATSRLADAIGELRAADDAGLAELNARIAALEVRMASMETQAKARAELESSSRKPYEQGDTGG